MRVVEQTVSSGEGAIFDLDEFLARPLYAHLATIAPGGPRDSPVWFHWDGASIWIIGGTSFPANLKQDPRCAFGAVDWNPATGQSHHVGIRGRAEVLPFDAQVVRTIFRKYFGPEEAKRDSRFNDVLTGEAGVEIVRVVPETVVIRDQSYRPAR